MPLATEESAIASRRGKWSRSGVPHRGWECVGIEDLGEPVAVCEMCESQEIRYVHHMCHTAYPSLLAVGCVCAGNMEQDLDAARHRDSLMVSRAAKRRRWLTRRWRVSAKGNDWLQADGYRVVVYPKGSRWGVTVASAGDDFLRHDFRSYPTADRAKLAAFDLVTRLLSSEPST
jgi:hypothetical protein